MDQDDAAERDVVEQQQEVTASESDYDDAVTEGDPRSIDDEVPEADALDQARTVRPTEAVRPRSIDDEVPEADGLDQAIEVVLDEEDGPREDAP